jgi:hypothetical protein
MGIFWSWLIGPFEKARQTSDSPENARSLPFQINQTSGSSSPDEDISRWSIPVNKLLPLLNRVKAEMEQCPELTYPPYHKWKAGDPLVWTGFSEPISQFFQLKRIDPRKDERFSEFYENMEQNLSSSYTWAHSSLQAMAGEWAYIWILFTVH